MAVKQQILTPVLHQPDSKGFVAEQGELLLQIYMAQTDRYGCLTLLGKPVLSLDAKEQHRLKQLLCTEGS